MDQIFVLVVFKFMSTVFSVLTFVKLFYLDLILYFPTARLMTFIKFQRTLHILCHIFVPPNIVAKESKDNAHFCPSTQKFYHQTDITKSNAQYPVPPHKCSRDKHHIPCSCLFSSAVMPGPSPAFFTTNIGLSSPSS